MRRVLVAVVVAGCVAGCSSGYDEQDHRDAVVAYTGVEMSDAQWEAHRDATLRACESEPNPLLQVVNAADPHLMSLEMEYACPERAEQLPDHIRP